MEKTALNTTTILMFLLTLVFTFAGLVHARSPQAAATIPYKSITTEEDYTIERTAIVVVRLITQARADIHRRDLALAKHELDEAAILMKSIRNDLSAAKAKNLIHIARNHLEYEQAEQVLKDLPPIIASLEQIDIYLPTDKAKLHIDRTKSYLEKNNKKDAERELALADSSLMVIEVEQPLLQSQQNVTKAQEYLAAKNPEKADEELKLAEQRATGLYTSMNLPVFKAKQHSWRAFRNYSAATHAETGENLAQARNYLNMAAAGGSAKLNKEASKLSSELGEVEKKLANEEKIAAATLKASWEKSWALAERSAAYLSASLSEAETTLGMESNLIEARLHVTYAETYQVTTLEADKAVKELDTAISYLQKAAANTLTDPTDRKKITRLVNTLQNLKLTPKENDITIQDRYDTVKEELSELLTGQKSTNELRELQGM